MRNKAYWIYSRQAGKAEDRMEGINHYDWGGITDEQRV
jgi:hypothetical protein